jgi:hypothetical protein
MDNKILIAISNKPTDTISLNKKNQKIPTQKIYQKKYNNKKYQSQ